MKILYKNIKSVRDAKEAEDKVVLDKIEVTIGGLSYEIRVFNQDRIKKEIDLEIEWRDEFMMDPGTIVINGVVNKLNIEAAILRLFEPGYFYLLQL